MGFKRLKHLAFKISQNKLLWMDIYINGHSFSLGQVMFQKHTPRAVDIYAFCDGTFSSFIVLVR